MTSPLLYIFILAGQSNMAGRGDAASLPSEFSRPSENIRYHWVCSFGADRGPPFSAGGAYISEGWVQLEACQKHPSTPGKHFGPEIAFGQRLQELLPNETIGIIKHGRGGSRLATDWLGSDGDDRQFYAAMMTQVKKALKALDEEGTRYRIGGFVWMQGEGDTTHQEYAEAYEQNMRTLLHKIRRDLNAPQLPVVIGRIGDGHVNSKMIYPEIVRMAQKDVADRDPWTTLVDTDDLPLGDSVHYDTRGLLELGKRFADALIGLKKGLRFPIKPRPPNHPPPP